MAAMSDIEVHTLTVHNSTTLDTFIKAVETGMRVEHLHLYYSTIFEVFQISESRVDLFLVDFGSTNDVSNSFLNFSCCDVTAHSIDITGPFNTNSSLITVFGSTLKATQFNVDHIGSPLLKSLESNILFNDLIIFDSIVELLFFINLSNSSFSNITISNFRSKFSTSSTISVTSSSFSFDNLLLEHIMSGDFFFFDDSIGSISNSELYYLNSSASFIHLLSSTLRVENVTAMMYQTFIHSFISDLFLQNIRISSSLENGQMLDDFFNYVDSQSHFIHLTSSNIFASCIVINNVLSHQLLYSSNSNLILDYINFSNIVLYSAFNFSNTIFTSNNLAFENLTLIDSFVTLYNSSCSLHLWTIQDIESLTLFKVFHSSLSICQMSVNFFESASLFNIFNSSVDFDTMSIQKCKSLPFWEMELYFIISYSSVLLNNFKFAGCIYQSVFKCDFEITNSSVILTNSTEVLFSSSLTAQNSSITFSSGYPIISKFASINQYFLFGNDPFINLSEIFLNISISPSQYCCNTSICQVSLNFYNIKYLSELLELSVPNNDEYSHNFRMNSLDFFLKDVISSNPMNNSLYFNLFISKIYSVQHLFIPICPIEFVSLEPPTRGGFVPLFAFNLGIYPIVIHHSTASINDYLEYSSNNHENLDLFLLRVMVVMKWLYLGQQILH
ncbi:hypothetical protein GEMRC1_009181 [Eukaryota sp. GEM-RC1]